MSQGQVRDFDDWAEELGTTDDPRKYDDYDVWSSIPDHLTDNPSSRIAPDLEVDVHGGLLYCKECDRRVTRNSSNHKEYGHDTSCGHHEFAEVIRG